MVNPLTKEQIELAKQQQRGIIAESDKAIADLQQNIDKLNSLVVQRTATRQQAQNTLADLEDDFPMLQSITTTSGSTDATSVVDTTLIGSSLALVGKTLKIKPSDPLMEDSASIVEFKEDKGEIVVGKSLKGGQVLKGVPYKVLDIISEV